MENDNLPHGWIFRRVITMRIDPQIEAYENLRQEAILRDKKDKKIRAKVIANGIIKSLGLDKI